MGQQWDNAKRTLSEWLNRLALHPTTQEEDFEESLEMYSFNKHGGGAATANRGLIENYGNVKWTEKIRRNLQPTKQQWTILTILAIQLVLISIAYQFYITKMLLWPFAIISTIFHEFGHALMCLLTGGSMGGIEIRMDESGATRFSGGWICVILPAGYIGSTLVGSSLVFMAFGYRTARYTTLAIILILLITLYYSASVFTLLSSIGLMILLLAAYFYQDGTFTRHFILFLGAIASLESILSILNGTVFNTIEGSDAYEFANRCSILLPAFFYGTLWFLISIALFLASIILALFIFKK